MKNLLGLFALMIFNVTGSVGQTNGIIDSTFGYNGVVTDSIKPTANITHIVRLATSTTLKSTSAPLIAVEDSSGGNSSFIKIIHYNPSTGQRILSFASGGVAILKLDSFSDIRGAFLQSKGTIIVCGTQFNVTTKIFSAQIKTDGTFDTSFGTNGIAYLPIQAGFQFLVGRDVVVQHQDGKVIVWGYAYKNNVRWSLVARFYSNGKIDSSFGVNGIVLNQYPSSPSSNQITDLMLLQSGKMVFVGGIEDSTHNYKSFFIVRLKSDGMLDSSFGNNGYVVNSFGGQFASVSSIIETDQGDLLLSCSFPDSSAKGFAANFGTCFILRYNQNGLPDLSFGVNGVLNTHIACDGYSGRIKFGAGVANRGNIFIAVPSLDSLSYSKSQYELLRAYSNGNIDTQYGRQNTGIVYAPVVNNSVMNNEPFDIDIRVDSTNLNNEEVYIVGNNGAYYTNIIKIRSFSIYTSVPTPVSGFTGVRIFPNPTTTTTTLSVTLLSSSFLSVNIYDQLGRLVLIPVSGKSYSPGTITLPLQTSSLIPGVYYITVQSGGEKQTVKMVIQ